jgi:hypothetical protein
MPRLTRDPNRLNYTINQQGKEYQLRLTQRAQSIFTNLMNLLPSNYISTVQGPNYTLEIKAVAVELAKLELALEDVDFDGNYQNTRSDFLYSIIGYLVFLNGKLPTTSFDDQEFKKFLLDVVKIYFRGSVPSAMRDGVQLLVSNQVTVLENFLLVRAGASGLDISDQFGFQVAIDATGGFPPDLFTIEQNIRLLLDIIRPAHTLFRIRYILDDPYTPNPDPPDPNDPVGVILDKMRWRLANYYYDDLRTYPRGLKDRDRLGTKVNQKVVAEDHSMDF